MKTVILTAPQGWGKTRNTEALCKEFGCNFVIDDWPATDATFEGALHLTNVHPDDIPAGYLLTADLVSRGWDGVVA